MTRTAMRSSVLLVALLLGACSLRPTSGAPPSPIGAGVTAAGAQGASPPSTSSPVVQDAPYARGDTVEPVKTPSWTTDPTTPGPIMSDDLTTVEGVEDEAMSYPSAPLPKELGESFGRNLPGNSDRRCVDVGNDTDVRSGEFVAGNFREYVRQWEPDMPDGRGKLYWIPLHPDKMRSLTVRAILLDHPTITETYHFNVIGWTENGPFYPSGIPLPRAGTWRLVATSGPDWGCFELTLPPSVPVRSPSARGEEVWDALRQRLLQLPRLGPGAPCPRAEPIQLPGTDEERGFGGRAIGKGPVYALAELGDGLVEHDPLAAPGWWKWTWHEVLWGIDPSYDGPVLVRGWQIDGPHKLRFDDRADELRIEAGDDASPGGWRDWPSAIRLRAPGCYAYQVDGLGFSQVVVFEAIPSPDSVGSYAPRARVT